MTRSAHAPLQAPADAVLASVRDVAGACFDISPQFLTGQTRLYEDLGADSVDILALVLELEREFSLSFPDQAATHIKTLADILPYLQPVQAADHARP